MKPNELNEKSICIFGYGKEGKATEVFLKQFAPQAHISILDKTIDADYLKKQKGYDLLIKTPGISKQLMTVPYTTATNLFFKYCNGTIIGVTGTKGKSTTSSLIYHIIRTSGKRAHLVGNIGTPALLSLLEPITKNDIFVIELSSYQLDDLHYSPHIALALNLFPEHMNYHGSLEKYYNAKKQITTYLKKNDYFVYHPGYKTLVDWGAKLDCQKIPYIPTPIPISEEEIPIQGLHNRENIQAAIRIASIFNIPNSDIIRALRSFKPLPHRLEYVGTHDGIIFYDDAISTTPESTIAAIETLEAVDTILLGGQQRGYNFSNLIRIIQQYQIKNIVFFPDTGLVIRDILDDVGYKYPHTLVTRNMKEAVDFAYRYTTKGRICLLSTASPSYSVWNNFEEKGDLFKRYINEYEKT